MHACVPIVTHAANAIMVSSLVLFVPIILLFHTCLPLPILLYFSFHHAYSFLIKVYRQSNSTWAIRHLPHNYSTMLAYIYIYGANKPHVNMYFACSARTSPSDGNNVSEDMGHTWILQHFSFRCDCQLNKAYP